MSLYSYSHMILNTTYKLSNSFLTKRINWFMLFLSNANSIQMQLFLPAICSVGIETAEINRLGAEFI